MAERVEEAAAARDGGPHALPQAASEEAPLLLSSTPLPFPPSVPVTGEEASRTWALLPEVVEPGQRV